MIENDDAGPGTVRTNRRTVRFLGDRRIKHRLQLARSIEMNLDNDDFFFSGAVSLEKALQPADFQA